MNYFHFARLVGSLLQLMTSCYSDQNQIRLVNGYNDCAGRVEVSHNDTWATVCDDYWDFKEATVVCRQLGCGNAVFALGNAYFGQGDGIILMDNVLCKGWESYLTDCRHKSDEEIDCLHTEDASVICADPGMCQSYPYICGLNADCFNIPNSYSCSCYEGFREIYTQILISASNPCQDIDECIDDPNICGPNALCINLFGSHDCTCYLGYLVKFAGSSPNITNPCEDVDECVPDLCGTHAQCYNTPGSYYCICEDGYTASPDPYWQIGITVCKSVQEYLDAFAAPEGQSQDLFILNEIETFLETNPDIVLPERTMTDTLTLALSVAVNLSFVDGLNDTISLPSAVLKIMEGLGSALVEPTTTYDRKSAQTATIEMSSVAIGPEGDAAEIQTLVAMRNVMEINLSAVAVNNNGSAAAVLMSFSDLEKFIYPNFSESENVSKMYSDIIIAALPKTRHKELPKPVKFTLYHKKTLQVGRIACVYWDLLEADWSEEGCTNSFSNESYTVCSCTHLSTFALLLQTEKQEEKEDDSLLETVNLFCMCVGLAFLAAAILTFLLCRWNPKINNTARLHLCTCLFTGHLLLLVGASRTENAVVCAAIAGILHFLFLASFVWMLLETLQLFLLIRSLTKVQVIQREGLKAQYLLLIGYGFPLVVVGVSAAVFPHGYGSKDQCWLNDAEHFQWSFIGPVCAILSLNLVSFCVIIWSLQPTLASMKSEISKSRDTRLITFKICAQFFVLGCSWILGFFQNSVTLKYIFIILNSQQGTFIFIVHCLLNKEVRAAYRRLLSCQLGPERPSTGNPREDTIKDSEDSTSQPTEDTNRADHNH